MSAGRPGRIESYVKYAELAYDLFHLGFDVLIIDHRGQGRSGRLLADPHLGHVNRFNDYVDDLAAFWQQEVQPGPWRKRYILAHSMGGAISTLFLQRHPGVCDAIALTAPMFGIVIRMPSFMARQILNWAEAHPRFRDGYAIGTGRWRALPFAINVLTHSRQRYRRNLRFYADDPTIRVGGPTYHWVRESILAGEQVLAGAGDDATPTLLLQAEEERVVDNRMHDRFCELRTAAGHPVEGGRPLVIKGAYHEILFEKDAMRSVALHAIVDFFNRHNSPSEWFMNRHRPEEMRFFKEAVFKYALYEPGLLEPEGVSKVFFTCDSHEKLLPLEQAINARWGDRVNVSFSTLTCLEVMAGGVSKGHALEAVAKKLGYSLQDCIAFGDGMNDAEMLSMAGKGCIMGSAHQRLKDLHPELEVIGTNAEDAVPHYLRKLYLS